MEFDKSIGHHSTFGVKTDGTVLAIGYNKDDQCDVSKWRNIVAIAGGGRHTIGLMKDGTVVAVGSDYNGRCNVSDWKNIKLPG